MRFTCAPRLRKISKIFVLISLNLLNLRGRYLAAWLLWLTEDIKLKKVYILIRLFLNLFCLRILLLLEWCLCLWLILWRQTWMAIHRGCLRCDSLFHIWNECSFFFIYGQRVWMLRIRYILSFNIFLSNICWDLFKCGWTFWFSKLGSYTLQQLLMRPTNRG